MPTWPTSPVTATIPVGSSPQGVVADPVTHVVYVGNYDSNTVSVINGASNVVIATVPVGSGPSLGAAIDPVTHDAYVTNQDSNDVSVSCRSRWA